MAYFNSWVQSTPGNTISVGPTAANANDVLIAWFVTDSGSTSPSPVWPTDFTNRVNLFTNSADGQTFGVATKNAATGSEGSLTLNDGNAAVSLIGGVAAFSGRDNTTPLDVAIVSGSTATDTSTPYPHSLSITPVTNGCDLILISGLDNNNSQNGVPTVTTTSGSTSAWTVEQDQGNGFYNVMFARATQTTAGAITAQVSWSLSSGSAQVSSALIALRPAAGGGGGGSAGHRIIGGWGGRVICG